MRTIRRARPYESRLAPRLGLVLLGLALCTGLYAYLGQRPARPDWGLIVEPRGAITWVDLGGPAELAGLRGGDRLRLPVDLHALTLTTLDRRGPPLRHAFPEPPGPTAYGIAGLLVCLYALSVCGAAWVSSASRRESTLVATTGLVGALVLLSYVGAQSGYTWPVRYGGAMRLVGADIWALGLSIPFNWFQYRGARRWVAGAGGALIAGAVIYGLGRAGGHPSRALQTLLIATFLPMIAAVALAQTLRPRGRTAVQRAQRTLLLATFLIGMLTIATLIILPRLTGSMVGPLEPTVAFAFLVIVLGITAATVRAGLLTLGAAARRAIARLALATILAIAFVLLAAALGQGKAPPPALAALYAVVASLATVSVLPWADRMVEGVLAPEIGLSRSLLASLAPELEGQRADPAALARIIERAAERIFPGMRAALLIRETDRRAVFAVPGRGPMLDLPALSAALGRDGLARKQAGGAAAAEWDALDAVLAGTSSHLLAVRAAGEPIALLAVVPREEPPPGCAMVEALGLLARETALHVNHARLQRERALEAAVSGRLAAALAGLPSAMGDLPALPERLAEALAGLPEVTASAVALRDDGGQVSTAARGPAPEGLAALIDDAPAPATGEAAATADASLVVPLGGGGGRLGALYVAWTPGRPVREYEGRLLGMFGSAVALALENARLFAGTAERARREAEEAEALATVSGAMARSLEPAELYTIILREAARVLPFDHAEIVLFQEGWAVSAASLGEPSIPPDTRLLPLDTTTSTWRSLAQGNVACMEDTADVPGWLDVPPWVGPYRIRCSLRVPLLVEGEVLGSFGINSFTPRFYGERHIRVAAAFGERAALALRNARLYAAEQARARAAEELALLRSDFVSSISHELRTPLAAILGYGELLKARWGHLSEADRLLRIDRIILSAQRQHRLVEDLLLASRLEQRALQPRAERTPLPTLMRHAADEVQGSYRGQRIDLQGPEDAVVLADPAYALQILVNLLDNAAKYSPEGSPIEAAWRPEDGMVAVRVRDHGPGIPEGAPFKGRYGVGMK